MDRTGAWQLAPASDLRLSRGPGGEYTLLVAGVGRRPGRSQIDQVAAEAGIKPKSAEVIVEEVDSAVATWSDAAAKA